MRYSFYNCYPISSDSGFSLGIFDKINLLDYMCFLDIFHHVKQYYQDIWIPSKINVLLGVKVTHFSNFWMNVVEMNHYSRNSHKYEDALIWHSLDINNCSEWVPNSMSFLVWKFVRLKKKLFGRVSSFPIRISHTVL